MTTNRNQGRTGGAAGAPRPPAGGPTGHRATGGEGASSINARTLAPEDYRTLLAARGLATGFYETHSCNAPRPTPDPAVAALAARRAADAEKREARRIADLPPFDARSASPAEVERRRRAIFGPYRDTTLGAAPMFQPVPKTPPPKPTPRSGDRGEWQRRGVERRAQNLADRLAAGERLDLSRVAPDVFERTMALRFGRFTG